MRKREVKREKVEEREKGVKREERALKNMEKIEARKNRTGRDHVIKDRKKRRKLETSTKMK